MKHRILVLTLIITLVSCKIEKAKEGINNEQKLEIMELSNKDKAQAFIKSFTTGSSKVLSFIDENITSHNNSLPDGKGTYIGYFTDTPSEATVEFIRVFEDNQFIIMHNRYVKCYLWAVIGI